MLINVISAYSERSARTSAVLTGAPCHCCTLWTCLPSMTVDCCLTATAAECLYKEQAGGDQTGHAVFQGTVDAVDCLCY